MDLLVLDLVADLSYGRPKHLSVLASGTLERRATDYMASTTLRLEFIQKAKRLGLELGDIREIMAFRERGEAPCCCVRDLVGHKIQEVDRRVAELEDMRRELRALQERANDLAARPSNTDSCHIIEKPAKAG
ncbi:MAG: MerR family DNA-binding protein [Chloroflexota bacterium]